MKRKHIIISLLAVGVILLCLSVILAVIATGNKNIIGGAGWPTFQFVFTCEKQGLYSKLANCGIAAIIASIAGIVKKKT